MSRAPNAIIAVFAACLAASAALSQPLPPLPGQLPLPAPPAPAAPSAPPQLPVLPGQGSALPALPNLPPQTPAAPAAAAPRDIAPVTPAPPATAATPVAPPMRSTGSSQADQVLSSVYLPGIASAILRKDSASLRDGRDVRNYVFSIYSGITSACGPTSDDMALYILGYLEPDMAPGKNMAVAGLKRLEQVIMGLGQVAKSGDIRDAVALGRTMDGTDKLIQEGQADGAVLGSLGCGTPLFREIRNDLEQMMRGRSGRNPMPSDPLVFASFMAPSYRDKLGIPDPEPQLRKRRIDAFAQQADKLCSGRYEPRGFCTCLLAGLRKSDLPEEDWKALADDFGTVPAVAAKRPEVTTMARACVRES